MKRTSHKIADELKISHGNVEGSAIFAQAIDNISENLGLETKNKLLSGKIKATKNAVISLSKEELRQNDGVTETAESIAIKKKKGRRKKIIAVQVVGCAVLSL